MILEKQPAMSGCANLSLAFGWLNSLVLCDQWPQSRPGLSSAACRLCRSIVRGLFSVISQPTSFVEDFSAIRRCRVDICFPVDPILHIFTRFTGPFQCQGMNHSQIRNHGSAVMNSAGCGIFIHIKIICSRLPDADPHAQRPTPCGLFRFC